MAKTLIAYFSRADENYFGGAMRYVKVGNTEIVCNHMKDIIDADMFKIEMKDPYSPVYMTCIEEAKKDLRANARPELVSMPDSIDAYDTVILAYPNYWGTFPMAVATFIDNYDFAGKKVILFATSGGSGFGKAVEQLKACAPKAEIHEGKILNGNPSAKELADWVSGLGV